MEISLVSDSPTELINKHGSNSVGQHLEQYDECSLGHLNTSTSTSA